MDEKEVKEAKKVDVEEVLQDPEDQLLTLKEYADRWGLKYESVRVAVNKRYKAELDTHTFTTAEGTYIDKFAQDFLDEKHKLRPASTFVIEQTVVEKLRRELSEKDKIIDALKDKITELQQAIIQMQLEKMDGMRLLADKQLLEQKLEDVQKQNTAYYESINEINGKLLEYQNSIYQSKDDIQKLTEELQTKEKQIKEAEEEKHRAWKSAEDESHRADNIERSYKKTIFGLYKKIKD